jgi:DNA topoisomerase IB
MAAFAKALAAHPTPRARQLGNTKAVCRKCYIHPAVIEAHFDGSLAQAMTGGSVEACVKRLLGRRQKPRSLVPMLKKSLRRLRRRNGTQLAGSAAHPSA